MTTPLFIISGPSGSGKTTLCAHLLKEFPQLHRVITYTTRSPRVGEVDGRDYMFVSPTHFEEMDSKNQFLETNKYYNYWYGTHCELLERLKHGQSCFIIPDINGAQRLAAVVPNTVAIWLDVSEELLAQRLHHRGTEPHDVQKARLLAGLRDRKKMQEMNLYQHYVDTTNFETAYASLKKIVTEAISQ